MIRLPKVSKQFPSLDILNSNFIENIYKWIEFMSVKVCVLHSWQHASMKKVGHRNMLVDATKYG